jgi:hypothetical protein
VVWRGVGPVDLALLLAIEHRPARPLVPNGVGHVCTFVHTLWRRRSRSRSLAASLGKNQQLLLLPALTPLPPSLDQQRGDEDQGSPKRDSRRPIEAIATREEQAGDRPQGTGRARVALRSAASIGRKQVTPPRLGLLPKRIYRRSAHGGGSLREPAQRFDPLFICEDCFCCICCVLSVSCASLSPCPQQS